MSRPQAVLKCSRCGEPRGYNKRAKGLCRSCEATCPVCEERPKARGTKQRAPYCRPCANAIQLAKLCVPGARERRAAQLRERHRVTPARELWRSAKARARRLGLPFAIEVNDVVVPALCPVLGTPLAIGTREEHNNSPSLDRIEPTKGYVKGNVVVISYRANSLRRDASVQELERVLIYAKTITGCV